MPSKEKLEALKKKVAGKGPVIKQNVMDNHVNKKVEVTIGDLREAIAANPKHAHCEPYKKACGDGVGGNPLPDDRKVTVDQVDIDALLQDGSVDHIREADKDGLPCCRKVLVAKEVATGGPKSKK